MSELQLAIEKIYGTSSETSSQFVAQDNLIGYTASGGVVVCKLTPQMNVQWQKFFCANNMISADPRQGFNGKFDEYGFPLHGEPEKITREGTNVGLEDNRDTTSENLGSRTLKFKKLDELGSTGLANRVRSINCIAISPDKKMLAVGEVGYQPRILVYSLAPGSSCRPIYIIQEHQFGINSLCFSSDSKKLCSLGLVNDGFLIIWKLQNKKLSFAGSNKCSSIINKLLWHDDHIITIGLRHIKIWKEDSLRSNSMILKGRNVLLKNFLNSSFIDIDCLNFSELLVMTDQGDLGLMNLNEESITLRKLYQLPSNTNQFLVDHIHENLILGGKGLSVVSLDDVFSNIAVNDHIKPTPSSPTKIVRRSGILAMQGVFDYRSLVYLRDEEILYTDTLLDSDTSNVLISSLLQGLNGLKRTCKGDILCWSKSGVIKKLTKQNADFFHSLELPSNELIDNALMSLDFDANDLVIGDKYGYLYFLEERKDFIKGFKESKRVRAHESSVNDVVLFKFGGDSYAASCSRDRTIQIFVKKAGSEEWNLLQTLTTHKGNVLKLAYVKGKLIASSSDRTLSIHKFEQEREDDDEQPQKYTALIYQDKIISIKSTALAFSVTTPGNELVISTNDKNMHIYNLDNYESVRTLKLLNKNMDAIQIDNFEVHEGLIYASSSDKCIRLFQYKDGKPIGSYWGHSETIIGLILIADEDSKRLVTASHDGCLFSWKLGSSIAGSCETQFSSPSSSGSELESVNMPQKVVRKILQGPDLTPKKTSPQTRLLTKTPSTNLSASRLSRTTSPSLSRSASVRASQRSGRTPAGSPENTNASPSLTRSYSTRSTISPTNNLVSRMSSLKLGKRTGEMSELVQSLTVSLKLLQESLAEEQSYDNHREELEVLGKEMAKTSRLLPGYDERLLDRYSSTLIAKLTDVLESEKNKENLVNK